MTSIQYKKCRMRAAFTMMEIMVVVFIIGLLAAMVGPRIMKQLFKGQTTTTQSTISALKNAITEFKMDTGRFPTQREGLKAIIENPGNIKGWDGPYLEGQDEAPQDAWQYDFIFNRPATVYKSKYKTYEIISYGSEEGESTPKDKWLHGGA